MKVNSVRFHVKGRGTIKVMNSTISKTRMAKTCTVSVCCQVAVLVLVMTGAKMRLGIVAFLMFLSRLIEALEYARKC